MRKLNLYLLIILVCSFHMVTAQNYFSPLSRFGIGELTDRQMIKYRGMGSTGISAIGINEFNVINPASFAKVKSFNLQSGVNAQLFEINTTSETFKSNHFSYPYLAFAVPVDTTRGIALGFSLNPFSTVKYQYKNPLAGATEKISGSGGLNEAAINAGARVFRSLKTKPGKDSAGRIIPDDTVKITNSLYFGLKAAYMFGSLYREHTLEYPFGSTNFNYLQSATDVVSDIAFSTGLIYELNLSKSDLMVGAVADFGSKLRTYQDELIYIYHPDYRSPSIDTIINSVSNRGNLNLPFGYGGGFTWKFRNSNRLDKWVICADYYTRKWSQLTSFSVSSGMSDMSKFSAGVQWTPYHIEFAGNGFAKYMRYVNYRAGVKMTTGYYPQSIGPISAKGVTIGLGFPIPKRGLPTEGKAFEELQYASFIDFAVELGKLGLVETNGVSKTYVNFSLGFHIFESDWFNRRKID